MKLRRTLVAAFFLSVIGITGCSDAGRICAPDVIPTCIPQQ